MRIAECDDATAMFTGAGDAQGHRLLADDLAETRAAIQAQERAAV